MGLVGGKRVAGLGGLGEWVGNGRINGMRWEGCGPGMPGPYRVALFVRRGGFPIRPQACPAAEGLRIAL